MIFLQAYISDCLHKTKLHHSRTHTHRNDINLLARSLSLSLAHSLTETHTHTHAYVQLQQYSAVALRLGHMDQLPSFPSFAHRK